MLLNFMNHLSKLAPALVVSSAVALTGCAMFKSANKAGFPTTYVEPTDTSNTARVRFISNITGTGIKPPGSNLSYVIVYHGIFGFYNQTQDIGMPKITYRKNDYKGYYFEIKALAGATEFHIRTDPTLRGSCHARFIVDLVKGRDYDINFDTSESKSSCKLHVSEIVKDDGTGVYILKPVDFVKK